MSAFNRKNNNSNLGSSADQKSALTPSDDSEMNRRQYSVVALGSKLPCVENNIGGDYVPPPCYCNQCRLEKRVADISGITRNGNLLSSAEIRGIPIAKLRKKQKQKVDDAKKDHQLRKERKERDLDRMRERDFKFRDTTLECSEQKCGLCDGDHIIKNRYMSDITILTCVEHMEGVVDECPDFYYYLDVLITKIGDDFAISDLYQRAFGKKFFTVEKYLEFLSKCDLPKASIKLRIQAVKHIMELHVKKVEEQRVELEKMKKNLFKSTVIEEKKVDKVEVEKKKITMQSMAEYLKKVLKNAKISKGLDFWLDKFMNVTSFIYLVLDSRNMAQVYSATHLFCSTVWQGGIVSKSMISAFATVIWRSMSLFSRRGYTEARLSDTLDDISSSLGSIVDGPIVKAITGCISAIASYKFFGAKTAAIIYNICGKAEKLTMIGLVQSVFNAIARISRVVELTLSGVPFSKALFEEDPFMAMIKKGKDLLYYKDHLYSGLPVEGHMERNEFVNQCKELIEFCEKFPKKIPEQLRFLCMQLTVEKVNVEKMINATSRMVPIVLVLHGGSGIGKGSLIEWFSALYCKIKGREYKPGVVYHKQMDSEYWEKYETYSHLITHFSEMGKETRERAKADPKPLAGTLLSLADRSPYICNTAFGDKGTVLFMSELIIIDTNNKELNFRDLFCKPGAFWRRCLFVEPIVKQNMRIPGTMQLDQSKVDPERTYDNWNFLVQTATSANNDMSPSYTNHLIPTGDSDIDALEKWFTKFVTKKISAYERLEKQISDNLAKLTGTFVKEDDDSSIGDSFLKDLFDSELEAKPVIDKLEMVTYSPFARKKMEEDAKIRAIPAEYIPFEKLEEYIYSHWTTDPQSVLDAISKAAWKHEQEKAQENIPLWRRVGMCLMNYTMYFFSYWLDAHLGVFWLVMRGHWLWATAKAAAIILFNIFVGYPMFFIVNMLFTFFVRNWGGNYYVRRGVWSAWRMMYWMYRWIYSLFFVAQSFDQMLGLPDGTSNIIGLLCGGIGLFAMGIQLIQAPFEIDRKLRGTEIVRPSHLEMYRVSTKANERLRAIDELTKTGPHVHKIPVKFPKTDNSYNIIMTSSPTKHVGNVEALIKIAVKHTLSVTICVGQSSMSQKAIEVGRGCILMNKHSLKIVKDKFQVQYWRGPPDGEPSVVNCGLEDVRECGPDTVVIYIGNNSSESVFAHIAPDDAVPTSTYGYIGDTQVDSIQLDKEPFKTKGLDPILYDRSYVYEWADHKDGMCGTLLIIRRGKGWCFGGIHCGHFDALSCCWATILNRQKIDEAISSLQKEDGMVPIVSRDEEFLADLKPRLSNNKSSVMYVEMPNVIVKGTTGEPVNAHQKSKVEPTKLAPITESLFQDRDEEIEFEEFMPPIMTPGMHFGQYLNPYNIALAKIGGRKKPLNRRLLRQIVSELTDRIVSEMKAKGIEELHPNDIEDAVNGSAFDPCFRRINASTGGGFGWPGAKDKYIPIVSDEDPQRIIREPIEELKLRIADMLETYAQGKSVGTVYKATLKDEPRAIKKVKQGKTRVFYASAVDFLIINRMYLGPFLSLFQALDSLCSAIGIDMHRQAHIIYDKLTSFSRLIMEGDYGKYDQSMPKDIGWAANSVIYKVCKAMGYNEYAQIVLQSLLSDMLFPCIEVLEDVMEAEALQPSGMYGTAEINSLRGLILLMYFWYSIEPSFRYWCGCLSRMSFFDYNCPFTYGDDVLNAVKPLVRKWVNNISYSKFVEDVYGMEYTSAAKGTVTVDFVEPESMTFLKRRFVYHEPLKRIVAPLSLSSIKCSLDWTIPSKVEPPEVQIVSTAMSVLREYVFHCQEESLFNCFRDRLIDAIVERYEKVSRKDFPTWNTILYSL